VFIPRRVLSTGAAILACCAGTGAAVAIAGGGFGAGSTEGCTNGSGTTECFSRHPHSGFSGGPGTSTATPESGTATAAPSAPTTANFTG
jgi:hypothetical protein